MTLLNHKHAQLFFVTAKRHLSHGRGCNLTLARPLLLGAADIRSSVLSGTASHPVATLQIPERLMAGMAARLEQSLPVGNEGAGVVVAAGTSAAAQALLGRTVAVLGGAMYTQFRCIAAAQCLVLPEGATPADGASCFVNPLTALGMVETMRREGHTALVHTAAANWQDRS